MMTSRRSLIACAMAALSLTAFCTASAQVYPRYPITIVVPFAAGGPADVVARILGDGMSTTLGQPIIVENVPGAGGTIGTGRVARAAPDGHVLALGILSTHVVNGAIYALPYDVAKDFEPIALLANTPQLILSRNAVPANDLKGLISWLKVNPGKLSMGTAGVGSPPHIGGVLFQNLIGTTLQFVPYRGSAPAMQDLVAGQIDLLIDPPGTSLPQVRAGRIKAFAVMDKSRVAVAPEIPTVDEAGLPGFHFTGWVAFFAPKGTPKPIIDKLNAATVDALAAPEVRARLADLGFELYPREEQTPEALGALQKADIEKWWPIIKAAGIKAE
jgi:tripartite-type tricarboxylate transporter receptor subunit TctC